MADKEYGRKAYVSDKSFPEFMRETTARSVWNSVTEVLPELSEFGGRLERLTSFERSVLELLRQSERKKPYLSPSYENMEYTWEGYTPGVKPPNTYPRPDLPTDTPSGYPPGPGIGLRIFSFSVLGCYCPGSTTNVQADGSHIITGIEVEDGSISNVIVMDPYTWTFDLTTSKTGGTVLVTGTMIAGDGTTGSGEDTIISCGEWQCCNLEWDETGADTMTTGSTINIGVTGGTSIYSWNVSGTNFVLGNATTLGTTNTLTAQVGSCGSAVITVTDSDGCVTTGSVRNTSSGSWVAQEGGSANASCLAPGIGARGATDGQWDSFDGQYWNRSTIKTTWSIGTTTAPGAFASCDEAYAALTGCGQPFCITCAEACAVNDGGFCKSPACDPCVTPDFSDPGFSGVCNYIKAFPECSDCNYDIPTDRFSLSQVCYCYNQNFLWKWEC